jgi:hypothetical protein
MYNKMFKITKYMLLITVLLVNLRTGLSQVTLFPGEAPVESVYQKNGDFGPTTPNAVGAFSTNFNRARGIISVGAEVQSNNYASWDYIDIHFYYNGNWVHVLRSYNVQRNGNATESSITQNITSSPTCHGVNTAQNAFQLAWYGGPENRCVHTGYSFGNANRENNYYVRNFDNLKRYNGFSYLPIAGGVVDRYLCSQDSTWTLQFDAYSSSKIYPVYNGPDPASNVLGGYSINNFSTAGNIAGIQYVQYDSNIGAMVFNISNVPPEMLSASSFKVRSYAHHDTQIHSRVCITTYNNENPIKNAPVGLTASTNVCGGVNLSWSNSSNTLPAEDIMYLKNVIFRDGVYLATVNDNVSSYTDATALQDVTYNYTLRHVAFTTLGKSYYQSNPSNSASGNVKPRPDIPLSPNATSNRCNGEIELTWQHNGSNPQYFKIERSTSSVGPYSVLTSSLAGTVRLFVDNTVTRGQQYYYNISSISDCNVISAGAAGISGISPSDPAMASSITATSNSITNVIDLTWADNANNEGKYQIVRTDDQGNTILTDINANSTSYTDNAAAACRLYSYKIRVFNSCVLSGVTSTTSAQATLPPPNLQNTFDATHKLVASKGYFGNRVEVSWGNNNGLNIDIFKIYRKQLGTALDSVQIASPSAGTALYIDNTADARVFYRYTIVGVKNCNGSDLLTNISSDIGFRNPAGLVSGHIEYNGGVAVGGAKILIQPSGANIGTALDFASGGNLTINDNATLEPGAQMRCEFWYKPVSLVSGNTIVDKANAFQFKYNGATYDASIFVGGVQKTINIPSASLALNQWNHVALVYDGSNFKTFANGILSSSLAVTGAVDNTVSNLVFGGGTSHFIMDEFRLLGQAAADSIISIESNRILNGDETGFKCNLHFDEATGSYAYDPSKVGNLFNGNHGLINSSVTWTNDRPTGSQLGYFGVTDALGNYISTGIRFIGSGENFNVVPQYQTHSFTPNSRSVYIGDASQVFNNQDFTDNSSFPFIGTLFYKGTTCPVPAAGLKIDGLPVVANGQQAVTDATGSFSISVPIGNHFVSVELYGHGMKAGRYPAVGTVNFQAPISGVTFVDSTTVKLVGRVVGGLIQANKVPGMGRSKNNIGQAQIILATPLTGTPCFTTTVVTNSATGEYVFDIPPMAYKIVDAFVTTNSVTISKTKLTNTSQVLDLTNTVLTKTFIKDSLFNNVGGFVSVDSITYNKRHDMIYRSATNLNVTSKDGSILIGNDTSTIGSIKIPLKPINTNTASLGAYGWGPFDWPLFTQKATYQLNIHANEIYMNTDNNVKDTVPLNGTIHITNSMVDGTDPNASFTFTNGISTYSFICGSPNIASNSLVPELSYTKDLQIIVVPEGAASVSWLPNSSNTPSNQNYHAIVLGQRITGTGIATQGPEKVDYILRDPPGSGSSSTWGSGQSLSNETQISVSSSAEEEASAKASVGTKEQIGLGVATEVDIETSPTLGLKNSISASLGTSFVETTTSTYAVSTRDDAGNVGAPADIFIGRSRNWLVGPTASVEMQTDAKCLTTGKCLGTSFGGYQLAQMPGYAIAPADVKTRFSYTQDEIENVVIPTLESLRNTILANNTSYQSLLLPSDPRFASNNDDPIWSLTGNDPRVYDVQDTGSAITTTLTGRSYIFHGRFQLKEDTVRSINTQIALWKQALGKNEKEKLACKNNTGGTLIDNFTLGSAIVTNSYESDTQTSISESFELSLSDSEGLDFKAEFNGTGIEGETNLTINTTSGASNNTTFANTNSFEYTLTDGDPGDIMSIDVYKTTTGDVFITRGGQTMCPYEDAVVCHYFNPTNPNAWISSHTYNAAGFATIANATVQREMPSISINPTIQYNIPSNQPAVYQLLLSNQSPLTVNNDIDLQVRIASVSNPYGAVLKIDGLSANTIINIPSGGSVVKTLTIERGPIEINYDSLMVIFSSACSEGIADTAYVTVHFIPTCTDLSITAPTDNFIINNSNNSLSNITIEDYNYNYGVVQNTMKVATGTYTYIASSTSTLTGLTTTAVATGTTYVNQPIAAHPNFGLEKIGFEFKPSNSSQWLQVQDFYKEMSAAQAAGTNTIYSIPQGQVYTQYQWTVTTQSYADGNYEIRTKSYCYNKDGSYAVIYSPVLAGVMDRVNPAPFGTPSPADGILDPNDDISIQFNEPIDISSLSYAPASNPNSNFDIRGVLNGTTLRHSESLNFDGTANYSEVAGGAALQKRPFTFEFWAKFNPTGAEQVVISQGTDPVQKMTFGFDASNNLKFALGTQVALTTTAVAIPTDWHHYAVVYDYANTAVSLFVDGALSGTNNNFLIDYTGSGKLAFGKDIQANNKYFKGNIHEVRLWSKARSSSDLVITMNKTLSRNQSGLVYNWKMDEATGIVAGDDIRSRNADIYGATWEVNPNGNATQFDGIDDNIKISSGNIAINKEMDFTLEFWFNSNQTGVSTLFSNGAGVANTADSLDAWTIQKDAAGALHVYHKGLDFVATSTNYFDNKWHHFALVMQRSTNLSAYVDGNLQNAVQGVSFNNLSGANLYLGAKATIAGTTVSFSDHFNGKLDEFRLWNVNRKAEQIKRDKQNRMLGDEHGLLAFLPFENYTVVLGTPSLSPTFNNQSLSTLTVTPQNGTSLIAQTPTIKLPRPIQAVNYTWALNGDKIILTTNTSPDQLENVTLDITVKNALDMHGNKMQSPKTWIAYINKNQVKWQDDQFNFEKTVDSVITFVAPIVNSGGAQKAFTIAGLPSWMTADITSGSIAPNSIQYITFTIPAGGTIGVYDAEVSVTTDFNFAEILRVNLKVKGVVPTWTVNPANFNYSMNIFGQLKIDNVIATNTENKIAAFNNGVICGVANLQYLPNYDRYEVFLNVYSNQITGDSIRFNIYDAASGLTFVNVSPSVMFVENDVVGTVTNPITFVANTEISRKIPLNAGWTWVSLPLKSNKLATSNLLMTSITPNNGDISTGITNYDQYDVGAGWLGNISQNGGYYNNQTYKIKKAVADTLIHIGARLNPDSIQAQISVVPGWNWIGFISNKNVGVAEALGNYTATTGDLIKSQYEFAYYDNLIGWTGSLTFMKPTLGYMLKSTGTSTFSYPLSSFIGKMANTNENLSASSSSQNLFPFSPEKYSNTMSAIITGNICNDALDNGNVAIGAFDNTNTLRGFAYPTLVNNVYKFFVTLYSNGEGEALNIKYFNTTDGLVIATNTVVTFATDAVLGTPSAPFIANVDAGSACHVVETTTGVNQIDNSNSISVYPNPFEDNLTVKFNQSVSAKIELIDVLGKVVYSSNIKNRKEFTINLDAQKAYVSSGMYYIRLTGDINEQIKVVKTK